MIYSIKHLIGKKLNAIDDTFGSCKDFYFDGKSFDVIYLIADTGGWLADRRVLLTPQTIENIDKHDLSKGIPITMGRERIEKSPVIETDKPVSKQQEYSLHDYYKWRPYWQIAPANVAGAAGSTAPVIVQTSEPLVDSPADGASVFQDPNLRSIDEVCGYSAVTTDQSSKANVHDFLVDSRDWSLQYIVVNTRPWFFGDHKILPIGEVNSIDLDSKSIRLSSSSTEIKNAPDAPEDIDPLHYRDLVEIKEKTSESPQ